jgi:hypothetical protein
MDTPADKIFEAVDLCNASKARFFEATSENGGTAPEPEASALFAALETVEVTSPATLHGFAVKLRFLADADESFLDQSSIRVLQLLRADFDKLVAAA